MNDINRAISAIVLTTISKIKSFAEISEAFHPVKYWPWTPLHLKPLKQYMMHC